MAERGVEPKVDANFDARDVQAKNVSGSTAGASSGDFHVYRQQRRAELERLERMEKEAGQKKEEKALFKAAEERRMREVNKTIKRAAKRKRKKELRQIRKKTQTEEVPALAAPEVQQNPQAVPTESHAHHNESPK